MNKIQSKGYRHKHNLTKIGTITKLKPIDHYITSACLLYEEAVLKLVIVTGKSLVSL